MYSTIPYSSPVVMVLNKEGTWRVCPDFRALNKLTIKDKFLVLIVYYILNELHGENYFTNLDRCLGYHQIRMKEAGISKTTLRTHEGHYEFLMTTFGIFNVPSTF
jgi:hypothetical protein